METRERPEAKGHLDQEEVEDTGVTEGNGAIGLRELIETTELKGPREAEIRRTEESARI